MFVVCSGAVEKKLTPLQVNEMWRQNLLTPTQISNYWDDLWSETDEEEEEDEGVIEGPPGIVNFCGTWEQTESLWRHR